MDPALLSNLDSWKASCCQTAATTKLEIEPECTINTLPLQRQARQGVL